MASGKSTLFGEPVAIVAALQTIATMLLSFGALDFIGLHSQHDLAVVSIALNAVAALYLAFKTHRTLLAPVVELFKALVVVATIYGYNLSTEHSGVIIAAITAVLALFHQSQVSPLEKGNFEPVA